MPELRDVLVLLREVRDPRPPVRLEAGGSEVRETGLRRLVNPADLAALEVALQLAARTGAAVTAVVAGDARLDDTLRLALSMGATRAIRLWDEDGAMKDGDAAADATVLARVLEVVRPGLFFTGHRLLDRGDDPTAALAAARRGMPCASAALACALSGAGLEILRKAAKGGRQRLTAPLPCAVLFDAIAAEPRYPDLPAVLAAMDAPLELWGVADLGLPASALGADGSLLRQGGLTGPRSDPLRVPTPDPTLPAHERVRALFSGGIRQRAGKMRFGGADEAVERILQILAEEGLVPRSRA
jgi:electron transfer flavoprotein beta subunit